MSERPDPKDNLSPEDSKSIEILSYAASTDSFRLDYEDSTLVRFYFDVPGEMNLLPGAAYPREEFLTAMDFYCQNRDLRTRVALALGEPQGIVRVFYPNQTELVATHIPALKVPELLEFAFQLARLDQKK